MGMAAFICIDYSETEMRCHLPFTIPTPCPLTEMPAEESYPFLSAGARLNKTGWYRLVKVSYKDGDLFVPHQGCPATGG
jgi:hypothetical protein